MHTLPSFLRLNDARRDKKALFEGLTAVEVEILDIVTKGPSGHVFGAPPGTEPDGTVILTPPGRKAVDKEIDQKIVDRMVRKGWLRFAAMPSGCGYFWPTDSAERLWKVLERC